MVNVEMQIIPLANFSYSQTITLAQFASHTQLTHCRPFFPPHLESEKEVFNVTEQKKNK